MSASENAQGAKPANPHLAGLIRPQQVLNLPFLGQDPAQKQKMFSAVNQYWTIINDANVPADSPQRKQALEKLTQLSNTMRARLTQWREQNPQAAGAQRPQSQGQPQVPQPQQQPQAPQAAAQTQPTQSAPPKAQQPSQIPPQIMKHISEFQFITPPDKPRGTEAGDQWLKKTREQYGNLLIQMEKAKSTISELDRVIETHRQRNMPVPAEVTNRKNEVSKSWEGWNSQVKRFRQSQAALQQQQSQQQAPQQPPQNNIQVKTEGAAIQSSAGTQNFNMQPPGQQNQQQPVQRPPSSAAVNPALANAQNQNRASMSPATAQTPSSYGQQQLPHQAGQQPPPSATAVRPPLNTQVGQASQSTLAGQQNSAVPLSQQEAIAQAQRSYSDRQTPQSAAGYAQVGSREPPASGSKFPIPKVLPDRATSQPTPVPMTAPRPTLSGPANGLGGMMGQAPVEKQPGTIMLDGGEGGVLSRKRLQELVREVGGPNETITPEVEELLLSLADEFVDSVISASCRLAKLRTAQDLQTRDLQMVLERNYNMRIPGYAGDETRVVRRFQPTPGWTQKLNAVQAAKVMGGKTDF